MSLIDVGIVGGGPAGLTAANTLARQLHTAVVFDSRSYRNLGSPHMHMILTWDHKSPDEYRNAARKNISENYSSIQFADVTVTEIQKKSDYFEVHDSNREVWKFKKIILAVGSADIYPGISGYGELWKKRIFHCLFCHGHEDKNATSSGVLAVPPIASAMMAVHMAQNAAQLSDRVTIYTNGDRNVTDELTRAFSALIESKFVIEPRQIGRLVGNDEDNSVKVEFVDGSSKEEKFLVHNPQTCPQGEFVDQLGLMLTPMGDIKADGPFYQTNVPGVYAIGDCSTPYKVIPSAITSGCNAAVAASAEIQAAKYSK